MRYPLLMLFAALAAALPDAHAVDGVMLIDQAKAMAGGVAPGDEPGFPVTISRGGSYRLSGNLTVSDLNAPAIRIATNAGVTLDLNGFGILGSLCGPARCAVNPPAVSGIDGWTMIDISNGWIDNFPAAGVWTSGRTSLRNLRLSRNGYCGAVLNHDARVAAVTAVHNGQCGLALNSGQVHNSHLAGNGRAQLSGANGATLASGNTLIGPLPMEAAGPGGVVSAGDNLCQAPSTTGVRC
jgi:hypothetical protein